MEFTIEAAPNELEEKREEFVKALSDSVALEAPTLADLLVKALPQKSPELKYRVLRDLKKKTEVAYKATLKAMLADIGKVLDNTGVTKSDVSPAQDDRTAPIVKQDALAYERIKSIYLRNGYSELDFEEGGPFYGYSTNMLITKLEEAK